MDKWFTDGYGLRPRGMVTIFAAFIALAGIAIGSLYATGVFKGDPFACPAGEHSYVVTYVMVPLTVGTSIVMMMQPVFGCESSAA